MRRGILAAVVLAALAAPATAQAHVEITPDEVAPGAGALWTITSPNENQSQALTGLTVTLPDGLEVEAIAPTPGFTAQIVRDQSGHATALSWQGGSIAPDQLGLFQFSGSVGTSDGDLQLVAVQTFADGSQKTWRGTAVIHVGSESTAASDSTARALGGVAIVLALAAAVIGLLAWRASRRAHA